MAITPESIAHLFSSCCQFSNFLQQPSPTDSLSGSLHTSNGDADLSHDCLHGVLDLLHLFGSVHVAVATLLGVNQGTGALNANFESTGYVGGGFTDDVQLQKQSTYGHGAQSHVRRQTHLSGEFCVKSFFDGHEFGVVTSSTAIGNFDIDSCHLRLRLCLNSKEERSCLSCASTIHHNTRSRCRNGPASVLQFD